MAKGKVCYLSRDLIFFLVNLLTLSATGSNKSVSEICEENFENEYFMPVDCFYMPNSAMEPTDKGKNGFKSNSAYPIFRNPHLSRNEQCLLKFFTPGGIYKKYLGHLKGICMVAYSSVDPQALGGADFDGDLVKVFYSNIIKEAVLKGAYEGDEKNFKRKLPIIDIPAPSVKEAKKSPSDSIEYDVIRKTFSNKIGQISNLAIRLGQIEYNDQASKEQLAALEQHSCAECTLLTGLEIDAAKTGVHPDLTSILESSTNIQDKLKYDYIQDFKEKVTELRSEKIHFTSGNIAKDGVDYFYKKFKGAKDEVLSYTYDDSFSTVNLLPKYFFDDMNVQMEDRSVSSKIPYFDFMESKDWKKSIDSNIQRKLEEILLAYNQILYINQKISKVKSIYGTESFERYAKYVINLQYDNPDVFYDDIISSLIEFDDMYTDVQSLNEAIERLKTDSSYIKWFCSYDNNLKEEALKKILGNDAIKSGSYDYLYNFDAHGYLTLYFLLLDAQGIKIMETDNSVLFTEMYLDDSRSFLRTPFYDTLLDEYKRLTDQKKAYWRKVIFSLCEEEIEQLMEDSNLSRDDIMPILYSLTATNKEDSNGIFFWNYFTAEELIRHVCIESEKEHE